MHYTISRGVVARMEVDAAIPPEWIQAVTSQQTASQALQTAWWGFFVTTHCSPSWVRSDDCFFTVFQDFQMLQAYSNPSFGSGTWQRIRVVVAKGKLHRVDLEITPGSSGFGLFGFGGASLALDWDHEEWLWPAVTLSELQYPSLSTLRIGRDIFIRQQRIRPTRLRFWLHVGLSYAFLHRFWRFIWSVCLGCDHKSRTTKILKTQFLLGTTMVYIMMKKMGYDSTRISCTSSLLESPRG